MVLSPKLSFFAKVPNKRLLDIMQWYANDIAILKSLDPELNIATSFREISTKRDLYFSWFVTGSVFPLLIAKLHRRPIIVVAGGSEVVQSVPMIAGYQAKSFFEKIIIQFVLNKADQIITVSEELKKEVLSLGVKRCETIYHGIRTDIFKPAGKENKFIFTISHLDKFNVERKRIKTIIRAIPLVIKDFPNQQFIIAGVKGDAFKELEELVKELKIKDNILFPGQISNEEKIGFFQKSLIYVQPTIHEAFGVAIAEAMSCGVPVIASNNTAVPEVVGDCGLYTDPDDPHELAQKIKLLIGDQDLRKNLGDRGRQRIIDCFSFKKRKENLTKLIEHELSKIGD